MTTSDVPAVPARMGATVLDHGVAFRVWAPNASRLDVVLNDDQTLPLDPDDEKVFAGIAPGAQPGDHYHLLVDGKRRAPDPYARFLPEGVHGPGEIIDPATFAWSDHNWPGLSMERLSVYELHIGTYTPEGTFEALRRELPELARLGVSAIELMPVNAFPGDRGWGYDGVALSAPAAVYGRPDDLRQLVDDAHAIGLGVILDVVYNHLGPEGNYLRVLSDEYFTDRHSTPWGDAINFDGPGSQFVRDWVIDNAIHWLSEYHLDGLRIDATDAIHDESPEHVLAELSDRARAAIDRPILLIAEEASNNVTTVQPRSDGGRGLDAVWADDFHHAVRVYLTGTREQYYADYGGSMAELARAITEGFVFQGEESAYLGEPRGTKVTDEPATAFLTCIQNHDQVGNRPFGERLHHDVSIEKYRVASALLLFLPQPVLLFMGQEFAASTPFLFFSDLGGDLGPLVTEGRRNEFAGFRAFSDASLRDAIPDPQAPATHDASRLDLAERTRHAGIYNLYRAMLAIRNDPSFDPGTDRRTTTAEPMGAHALVVTRHDGSRWRRLVANFGSRLEVTMDDPADGRILLSTNDEQFGGDGVHPDLREDGGTLVVPARTAVLLEGDVASART